MLQTGALTECRLTRLDGKQSSPGNKTGKRPLAQRRRRKSDRSQKIVQVWNFNGVQMRVSGFKSINEFVLHAVAKQKP